MKESDLPLLKKFAGKYIWWKTPEEALAMPNQVMSQIMDIGDYMDVQDLVHQVGDEVLRTVISQAQAGQFSPRSWKYWHYRLELAKLGQVPPLPVRKLN